MTAIPVSITLPPHLSASQVGTMKKCPWQWALGRGLKVPERPSWATVAGSAVHKASEWWDHWTLNGTWETDHATVADLFFKAFDEEIAEKLKWEPDYTKEDWRASGRATKAWPEKENEAYWRAEGPSHLMSWVTWRMNNPQWEIITDPFVGIEVEFTVKIGGIDVRGYIDRVFHKNETEVMVVDLKTGSYTPDDGEQLGIYGYALSEKYGVWPAWGSYWMSRQGGTTAPEDMRLWPKERLDYTFATTRAQQEAGQFLPHKTNMCSGCSVRDYCLAVNGSQSHTVPTPWELTVKLPEVSA